MKTQTKQKKAALKTIDASRLKAFAAKLLNKGGFTAEEATAIAESLTLSEMIGHGSHGIIRIKEYLNDLKKGVVVSNVQLHIVQETPNSLTADAQLGVGQFMMPKLLEKIYAKLATQAVVSAAVRMCGHIGRLGEWVEAAANAGYPSLLFTNDNGTGFYVAPPGGKQAMISTNPIAFAIPLPDGKVFLADMSTSAVAYGKIRLAHLNGNVLPPGCIQDADGNATCDPQALLSNPKGSIMPMGGAQGYKGFALSMFLDILVAGLSGGQTSSAHANTKYANNLTMVLWNPKFFSGLEYMQSQAKQYIDFIRSCPPTDPAKPIRLAGDRMNLLKDENEDIPLNESLVEDLLNIAEELDVMPPTELADSNKMHIVK